MSVLLDLTVAGVTIPVLLETLVRPQRLSTLLIHSACQTPIGHEQSCPHCRCKIFRPEPIVAAPPASVPAVTPPPVGQAAPARTVNTTRCRPPTKARSEIPVAGGKAQTPPKLLHCPNTKCGKEIAGEARETAFCPKCQHGLVEAEVLSAYRGPGKGLVALTNEERAKIEALRMKKGIEVLRSLTNWTPSTAEIDGVYQLVPKKGSELAFSCFLKTTQSGPFVYQAAMCRVEEKGMTLCHESMVVIKLDNDGKTLLLHPLLAEDEVQRVQVGIIEVPTDLQEAMDLQIASAYSGRRQPLPSRTPADHALRSTLAAKREGREYIIEDPVQLSRQQQAAAAQLNERLTPAKPKKASKKTAETAS